MQQSLALLSGLAAAAPLRFGSAAGQQQFFLRPQDTCDTRYRHRR